MSLICLLCVLITAIKLSYSEPRYETAHKGKIVNGFPAFIENFPFQASLQAPNHYCGGSIINPTFILTAGHCAFVAPAEKVKVRTGSTYWDDGGVLNSVKIMIVHPDFSPDTLTYDFALIELMAPLNFNPATQPVKLVNERYRIVAGYMVTVSGFGETLNANQSDQRLRAVRLPVVAKRSCNETYSFLGGITDQMICAGYQGGKYR